MEIPCDRLNDRFKLLLHRYSHVHTRMHACALVMIERHGVYTNKIQKLKAKWYFVLI